MLLPRASLGTRLTISSYARTLLRSYTRGILLARTSLGVLAIRAGASSDRLLLLSVGPSRGGRVRQLRRSISLGSR